jgi:hypothetical protein
MGGCVTEFAAFDADGYPTEDTLRKIEDWPNSDPHGWFDYIKSAMHKTYSKVHDYVRQDIDNKASVRTLILITCGWSGNEEVLRAMAANLMWFITWKQSCSGGMHTFEIPDSWQKQERDM